MYTEVMVTSLILTLLLFNGYEIEFCEDNNS